LSIDFTSKIMIVVTRIPCPTRDVSDNKPYSATVYCTFAASDTFRMETMNFV